MTFGSQEVECYVSISAGEKLGVRWEMSESHDEVKVGRVSQGGVGESAGIEAGMKLVSIDGHRVGTTQEIEGFLEGVKKRGGGVIVVRRSSPIALPVQTPLFGALMDTYETPAEDGNPFRFNISSNTSEADTQSLMSYGEWKEPQNEDPETSPGSSIVSSCPTSPEFSLVAGKKMRSVRKKKPSGLASLVDSSSLIDNNSFNNGSFSDPYAQKARKVQSCENYLSCLDEQALENLVSTVSSTAPCFPKSHSFSSPSPFANITSCLKGHGASRIRRSVSDAVKHASWAPEVTTPTTRTGSLPNRVERGVGWNY